MNTQSFVAELLAYEHGKDLLKKADAHRLERQVKQQHLQAKLLRRAATRLSSLTEHVSYLREIVAAKDYFSSPSA